MKPTAMAEPVEEQHDPQMDHQTVMRAHEVISNPKRLAAVHALHKSAGGLFDKMKAAKAKLDSQPTAPAPMPEEKE